MVITAGIFYLAAHTFVDPDIWWHLRSGIIFWQSKMINQSDPFSFLTMNWQWIDHEWLFEVVIAYIYSHFSWLGLVIFKTALALCIPALMYPLLKKMGSG